ncbi:MAG TPA: 50S ribosomal protein L29 [Firmicutes bacterium]|nr:MAG: 50S ribosomal protein L29 [Candidatus Omnitrophota bacterium]HDD64914.1 50S ribosomal protein L29 [Bacillota bacterium]
MKKEELKKWREATEKEIEEKINELKAQLFNLRHQLRLGQLKNYSQLREIRKDIARLNTILREKQLQKERENGGK